MSTRNAKLSDANAIAQVHVASWKSTYRGLLPDGLLDNLSVERSTSRWTQVLTEQTSQVSVFEKDGSVVGFVSFGASRDKDADRQKVGEIEAIYFNADVHRKGYGKALLDEALGSLREQGFSEVTLWVLHNNQRAIKFYKAVGFNADGAARVDIRQDGTELHETRFRRSIL